MKLPKSFYTHPDVEQIARDLLGKHLYTSKDGIQTGGMIVETEAYSGVNDLASHSNNNRRTARTEVMYQEGGVAYVYLIYGMYHLFNVITNGKDRADAVLIRGLEPTEGIPEMLLRRNMQSLKPNLSAGPGVLSKALGIDKKLYGADLAGSAVWLEDKGIVVPPESVIAGPRIGVSYAGEDALRPWRFWLKGNKWVSKQR